MPIARLTEIGLKLADDAVFAIGAELEAGHHAPEEILRDLVDRKLAEWVTPDGVPAQLTSAIAAYRAAFEPLRHNIVAMVDAAEAASTQAAARAVVTALTEAAPTDVLALDGRIHALFVRAEADDEPLSDGGSPVPPGTEADASQAGGGADGPLPPAEARGAPAKAARKRAGKASQ
jgi:hypothetical protein